MYWVISPFIAGNSVSISIRFDFGINDQRKAYINIEYTVIYLSYFDACDAFAAALYFAGYSRQFRNEMWYIAWMGSKIDGDNWT